MSPLSLRAVIWDLGGVLVRTEDLSSRERLAKRLGTTRLALEELVFTSDSGQRLQLGELTEQQHWENVACSLNLEPDELEQFQADFWAGDRLDDRLVDFIRSLRPDYKTGLLSNHFPDLRRALREDWKIEDAFDAIVISAEVGLLKPDPQIYWLALNRLHVTPAEAVFIDDFGRNLAGAEAIGLRTIHFSSTDQVRSELKRLLAGDQ